MQLQSLPDVSQEMRIAPGQILRFPGAELDIRPGTKVLLDFMWPGRKFWAEFVGMRQDRYVLLHPPLAPDNLESYKRDTQATVRYVHRCYHICGFTTWVRQLVMKPAPLLFLEYPKTIEVLNMRRHERAASILPATVHHAGNELPAVIVNISSGGCRVVLRSGVEAEAAPDPGREIFCSFVLPGAAQGLHARGLVRSCENANGKIALGVRFDGMEPGQAQAINAFVAEVRDYLAA